MTVEAGKSGRREWLVDRRPSIDPRIPLGDPPCVIRQQVRPLWIEELGETRPRSVVHEPGDDLDPPLAQPLQPLVMP
jgi:hypothetical protein